MTQPKDDDFDGIPLEGYQPPTGEIEWAHCWSCQDSKPLNRMAVLGVECTLPCCLTCWEKMPVADRLKVARELATYTETNAANRALADAMSIFAAKIREVDATLHGKDDDDPPGQFDWLTGRRN